MAAAVFVGAGIPNASVTDPVIAPLVAQRDRLVTRVAELKSRRPEPDGTDAGVVDEGSATDYRRELERLLVELAQVSREIRQRSAQS